MMNRSTCPIIVGGCHRSGTSLVRRILDAHSRIHCGPEVKFFRDFYGDYLHDPLSHARFVQSARAILADSDLLEILGHAFIRVHERAAERAQKPRWADKTPENVLYLDQWERLLGSDWLLVHVVRHPLDTLASIKEAPFRRTLPPSIDEQIAWFRRYTEAGLHFRSLHPHRYVGVVYEHLVSEPQAAIAELMRGSGEQFEAGQLSFNESPHQTGLEDPKVAYTDGIHGHSVGRWRAVLTEDERGQISDTCESLWRRIDPENRFGYSALQSGSEPQRT